MSQLKENNLFVRTKNDLTISLSDVKTLKKREGKAFGNYVEITTYDGEIYETKEMSKTMLSPARMLSKWFIDKI